MKQTFDYRQFDMLVKVINQFSPDPEGLRSDSGNRCLYNPPKSKPKSIGCAIGMFLPVELTQKMDKVKSPGIRSICQNKRLAPLLPAWLKEMDQEFLTSIQSLHDGSYNWNEATSGLSEEGKFCVQDICRRYKLPVTRVAQATGQDI